MPTVRLLQSAVAAIPLLTRPPLAAMPVHLIRWLSKSKNPKGGRELSKPNSSATGKR
jgi:hypothetical protein